MKKISWDLPFKTMHYLESLTDELAILPAVAMMTGIQTPDGEIGKVNIFVKEDGAEDMDTALVYLGAIMGNHSATYAAEIEEAGMNMIGKINGLCDDIFERMAKQSEMPVVMHEGITNTHVEVKEGVIHVMPSSDDLFEKAEKEEVKAPHGFKEEETGCTLKSVVEDTHEVEAKVEEVETEEAPKVTTLPEATEEDEEKVEKVVEKIVRTKEVQAGLKPKSKAKDTKFRAKLRVILKNFMK